MSKFIKINSLRINLDEIKAYKFHRDNTYNFPLRAIFYMKSGNKADDAQITDGFRLDDESLWKEIGGKIDSYFIQSNTDLQL